MIFSRRVWLSMIVLVATAISVVVLATGGAVLPNFLTRSLSSQLASPVSLMATSFFDDYDTLDFVDEKSLSGVVWDGRSALVFSGSRAGVIGKMTSKRFYTGPVADLSVNLTGDATSAVAVEVSSDLGATWCSPPFQSCLKGETFQYRLTFGAPATVSQIMILWRPRSLAVIDPPVPVPTPLLTFWGTFLDAPSAEWSEYLKVVRQLKENGSITHLPVRVWTPSADISSRLADLRVLGLPLAFFSSPGHRFLTKPTELDPVNHASNNQNLKYFDTPGFDPYQCQGTAGCATRPHVTAHDPAYTGVVWQKELDHLSASLDRVGLRAGDVVIFDTEVWAYGVDYYYPDVILNSLGRYQGTPTERYDTYRSNWLARARELVAIVRSKVSGAPVLFYGENQPTYSNPGENWMLPGSGDAPAPVFYWLPDLDLVKSKLAPATWSNAYPWVSFSFSAPTWKAEVWEPLKTQKLGFLLKAAGARGAIIYPGPFDHAVEWNIPANLYVAHAKAFTDGFLRGLDPDAPPADTTSPPISGDKIAPTIQAVTAFDLGQDQVTIAWTTDEPATSQIDYGLTTNYGQTTALDKTLVTVRRRTIARLNPETLYHYRVKSADSAGNLAQSSDFTFTTLSPSVSPDVTSPPFVSLSGAAIRRVVDEEVSHSSELNRRLDDFTDNRAQLSIWNNGADYGAELQRLINALPTTGGTITIAPGRYLIKQGIRITKNNVRIFGSRLGEVFFEDDGVAGALLEVGTWSKADLSGIVFWGMKRGRVAALSARAAPQLTVSDNGFIDFDTALLVNADSTILNSGIIIKNNFFFNNGYLTLRVEGSRQTSGSNCDAVVGGARIENNFLDGNYQGINFLCVNDSAVIGNIIRDSDIGGLRIETSARNVIEKNLLHQNKLMGLWLYATSVGNQFRDNIVIDNNQSHQPFVSDCWKPSESISQAYLNDRDPGRQYYPYLKQENGQFVFTNYFCQFNGDEIELRNSISQTVFVNNIVGRYRSIGGGPSFHDLRIALFPIFYGWGKNPTDFLSRQNQFTDNVFLNSEPARLLNQGCGNSFTGNKNLASQDSQLTSLTPVVNSGYQALCQGQGLCNANNRCEAEQGEWSGNCASDCPLIPLGGQGSRTRHDQCLSPLKITEPIFPARPGCVNVYDGSFRCTTANDGRCDSEQGENYCNSFDCATIVADAPPPAAGGNGGGGSGGGGGGSGGSSLSSPPSSLVSSQSTAARIVELQARIAELKKILISLLRRRVEQLTLLLHLLLGR